MFFHQDLGMELARFGGLLYQVLNRYGKYLAVLQENLEKILVSLEAQHINKFGKWLSLIFLPKPFHEIIAVLWQCIIAMI